MIVGAYHIGMLPGWRELVAEQVGRIRSSGLLARTDKILVGLCCDDKPDLEALNRLMDGKAVFEINPSTTIFEFLTIRMLHEYAKKEDFKAWYIHTKGVWHGNHGHRKQMECVVIDNHDLCVQLLDRYDTCGTLFASLGMYYRGNFWWATSSYLRTLPDVDAPDPTDRVLSELWLGLNPSNRAFNIGAERTGPFVGRPATGTMPRPPSKPSRIVGAYQIAMQPGWKWVVKEQVARLKSSGLLARTDRVLIGMPCDETPGATEIVEMLDGKAVIGTNGTLRTLHEQAKRDDFKAWFIHTEGVWHDNHGLRRSQERAVVDGHELCLSLLDEHDTCGPYWRPKGSYGLDCGHYCGNFWWARSSYIKSLPDVEKPDGFWLGLSDKHVPCEIFVDAVTNGVSTQQT